MFRRLLVVVALGIFLSAEQAQASGQQAAIAAGKPRIAGHVLPALQRAKPIRIALDAVNADQPLSLTIVLNRNDPAGFDRFLADVYDPLSPRFRQFLSPKEISDRFGPSNADYDVVEGFLQGQGFTVTETSPNRMTLVVTGTRGLAEKAFRLDLRDYELSGRRFFANDADPELPAVVAPHVEAVIGLNDLARPASLNQGSGCGGKDPVSCFIQKFAAGFAAYEEEGCLTKLLFVISALLLIAFSGAFLGIIVFTIEEVIAELIAAFLLDCIVAPMVGGHPPHLSRSSKSSRLSAGPDGTGQKIGLLEFDSFHSSDVADFLAFNGFPSTQLAQLSEVKVNGGAPIGGGESEVLLDIDAVMTLAHGASVAVYDAPFSGGASFQALFNRMINDGVTVISNSWSYCEDQTTLADVQSLDSILATAAASGIGVYNAAGDSGSSCLDGSPGTIGVPADSPHATAVGGASITLDESFSFQSASWWDGSASTPTTGQGGFGVSGFFARPSYQDGFTSATGRSVPDVVANADPATGLAICQGDAGGCPRDLFNGGTSLAAPIWASYAAILNDSFGQNLGLLNHGMYALSGSDAFHGSAELGSDFDHVGIGLPNLSFLTLGLAGLDPGPGDAANSDVNSVPSSVSADGTTQGHVVVQLLDSLGAVVPGKTVSLAKSGGTSAVVSPATAITSVADGTAKFTITDAVVEDVTFTAHDDTDGVGVTKTALVHFVAPPAASGSVVASPTTVAADGSSSTTITVTLHDANDNGAVGKTVSLAQGAGRSVISGPTPATTDANGQVVFTATDTFTESVTYTATDVTDGNLPVPDTGTSTVSFTSGSGSSCPVGQIVAAAGWSVTSPVTGFSVSNNCVGVSGTAWDHDGNLWALNYPTGKLYKFPPAGGVASAGTLVGTLPNVTPPTGLTTCPHGLTFSKDGQHLYVARQFCGGGGDVVEVSTSDASIVRNLTGSDAIHCATGIATDPISGDLFVASPCQSGNSVWRIANPESNSPTLSVYASPGRAIGMNFTPDGTLWAEVYPFGTGDHEIVKISGTNSGSPGTVTVLSANAPGSAGGVLPAFDPSTPGSPSFLFATNGTTSGSSGSVVKVDLTQNPPVVTTVATGGTGELFVNGGPDGCAYVSNGDRIDRITADDGTCHFATSSTVPTLSLSPASANPAQGSSQTLTAQFSHVSVPAGTPVVFQVAGANPQVKMGTTNANGTASVPYAGAFAGTDTVLASATVSGNPFASNEATITWSSGSHLTLLSLNTCPTSGTEGVSVTLQAGLYDISVDPAIPVSGASLHFALGGQSCDGSTDGTGVATCGITPASGGNFTLTVSYAGSLAASTRRALVVRSTAPAVYVPASSSTSFFVKCAACMVAPLSDLFEGVAPSAQSSEPNGIIEPGETKGFRPLWINVSGAGFTGNAFTGDLSDPILAGGTLTTPTPHAQYPNLAAGAGGSCTSCYTLGASFTSGRPQVHVDATVLETPSIGGVPDGADAHSWTIHIGKSFTDVLPSNIFYTYVETMVHNAVTFGVGNDSYAPLQKTPRNQMAAFIARADARGDGNVPAAGTVSSLNNPAVHGSYDCTSGGKSLFADVAPTDQFCKYIHYLTNLNVTIGCNTLNPPGYCQGTVVTRANMAIFISRWVRGARGFADPDGAINDADTDGSSRTYDCTNGPSPFLDVPLNDPPGTNPSCRNIGELWVMHVIDGDGAGHFLPNKGVSRQEMAKFIVNGGRLSINNP